MGFLSACLGLAAEDERMPELLRRAALQFVRAGGSVTLTEWAGLSAEEREALVAAHESVYDGSETGIGEALREAVEP